MKWHWIRHLTLVIAMIVSFHRAPPATAHGFPAPPKAKTIQARPPTPVLSVDKLVKQVTTKIFPKQTFAEALLDAQETIVERFGVLDIAAVMLLLSGASQTIFPQYDGYITSHALAVITGNGLVLARVDEGFQSDFDINSPNLLFYAPKKLDRKSGYKDLLPDGPYTLIGWGYFTDYDPRRIPTLAGFDVSDELFVHEAGFHLSNGGFLATPPDESFPGERTAGIPDKDDYKEELRKLKGMPQVLGGHGRCWDIHVWRGDKTTDDGVPVMSVAVPEEWGVLPPADKTLTLEDAFFVPEVL